VGQFKNLEEIERVIVTQNEESPVYIQDIAQVEDTFKDKNFEVKINGHPTIVFPISKKEDENTIQVTEAVLKEMEKLNRELSYKGIQIKSSYIAADYIWEAIDHLKVSLALGALLAAFVLFIFLRHLYFTFIISLTIPISMIATFIFLNLTGRSINIISLAGLGFAVGMVVDNAIVVLENIFRHLQMKKSSMKAAFDGTVEVWGAADRTYVSVSGASRYDALDLEALDARVGASGASEARVWVRDYLEADASGASRVRFRGNPVVTARVSGASTVTRW